MRIRKAQHGRCRHNNRRVRDHLPPMNRRFQAMNLIVRISAMSRFLTNWSGRQYLINNAFLSIAV